MKDFAIKPPIEWATMTTFLLDKPKAGFAVILPKTVERSLPSWFTERTLLLYATAYSLYRFVSWVPWKNWPKFSQPSIPSVKSRPNDGVKSMP